MFCRLCAPSTWGRATPPRPSKTLRGRVLHAARQRRRRSPRRKWPRSFRRRRHYPTLLDPTEPYQTLPEEPSRQYTGRYRTLPGPTSRFYQPFCLLNPIGSISAPTRGDVQTQLKLLHPQGNVAVLQTRPVGSEAWRGATHGSAADTARPWQSLPDPTRRYEQVGQVVKSGVSLNTANWWTRIDPKST